MNLQKQESQSWVGGCMCSKVKSKLVSMQVFSNTEFVLMHIMSELLHIQRQSAYLIGRDRLVADIPIEHPSCSKQHAVIQCKFFALDYL